MSTTPISVLLCGGPLAGQTLRIAGAGKYINVPYSVPWPIGDGGEAVQVPWGVYVYRHSDGDAEAEFVCEMTRGGW